MNDCQSNEMTMWVWRRQNKHEKISLGGKGGVGVNHQLLSFHLHSHGFAQSVTHSEIQRESGSVSSSSR